MGKHNPSFYNQEYQTVNISNYSMYPPIKLFISGYFIVDIVFMLYSETSKDICIYLLLLASGTVLDLIILNDFYQFYGQNLSAYKASLDLLDSSILSKEKDFTSIPSISGGSGKLSGGNLNHQNQFGSGISLKQIFDTFLLTLLVIYRLFRIYSVAKTWLPKFKQTYKLLSQESNGSSEAYPQQPQFSTESSLDESLPASPEITVNSQLKLAPLISSQNIGSPQVVAAAGNPSNILQTSSLIEERDSEKLHPGSTNTTISTPLAQNAALDHKKIQDSQLSDKNLTTLPIKVTNNSHNTEQAVTALTTHTAQSGQPQSTQNKSQTTNKSKASSLINSDFNGSQSSSENNINPTDVELQLSIQQKNKDLKVTELSSAATNRTGQTNNTISKQNDMNSSDSQKNLLTKSQQQTSDKELIDSENKSAPTFNSNSGTNRNTRKQQQSQKYTSKYQNSPQKSTTEQGGVKIQQKGLANNINTSSNNSGKSDSKQISKDQISNLKTNTSSIIPSSSIINSVEDKRETFKNVNQSSITKPSLSPKKVLNAEPNNPSKKPTKGSTATQNIPVSSQPKDNINQLKANEKSQKPSVASKKQQVYVKKKEIINTAATSSQILQSASTDILINGKVEKRGLFEQNESKKVQYKSENNSNYHKEEKVKNNASEVANNPQNDSIKSEESNVKYQQQLQYENKINSQKTSSIELLQNNISQIKEKKEEKVQLEIVDQREPIIQSQTEQEEEEEREINNQRIGPSSINESNGENSSHAVSPKYEQLKSKYEALKASSLTPNNISQNQCAVANASGEGMVVSTNSQNKSSRKFSFEQDDETSSEDSGENNSQQVYKEDIQLDKPSNSKSPCFVLGSSSSSSLQSLQNSQRKLNERSQKKIPSNVSAAKQAKTPIDSPSNKFVKKDQRSTIQEEEQEIHSTTQPIVDESNRNRGETLGNIKADEHHSSFKLDPQSVLSHTDGYIKESKPTRQQKDSWESVTDIHKEDINHDDPHYINYLANPLLEFLSLPYRSPNIHALSPSANGKLSIGTSFQGLLFQQIGNWNESQQLYYQKSVTPENFQTTSNTLSPKLPQHYYEHNEKAKKRKSTNVNSEDVVSDQEKQNNPTAWHHISGHDENSSYDEYQNGQQDQNGYDSNQDSNPELRSNQLPLIEKIEFKQSQSILTGPNNLFMDSNRQFEKTLQNNDILIQDQPQNILEFNSSISQTGESAFKAAEDNLIQVSTVFEQPITIDVKGQNGITFEVEIQQLSDFGGCFEEECEKNGLNREDILASKITILTNFLQQSFVNENLSLLHEITMLLNEVTIEYTLKIYDNKIPTESKESFARLVRNQYEDQYDLEESDNNNYEEDQSVTSIYNGFNEIPFNMSASKFAALQQMAFLSNNQYNPLTSPIQLNRFYQTKHIGDSDLHINLPEFNVNNDFTETQTLSNPLLNSLFPNFLDISKNASAIQQSMGNISPMAPPPGMGKQFSVQQPSNVQRINHVQPYSVADIDYYGQENRSEQQQLFNLIQLNQTLHSQINSELQLTSPPTKSYLLKNNNTIVKPIPIHSSRSGSTQQFPFAANTWQAPNQLSSTPNQLGQSSTQLNSAQNIGSISSSEKFNLSMSSSSKKIKQPNSLLQNGIYDQWKFNPSSLTGTPNLQAQQPQVPTVNSNGDFGPQAVGNSSVGRGQRIWQPQTPYLLDAPKPNLLSKPQPTISNSNNLFSKDLLNQLAQLGQPVK